METLLLHYLTRLGAVGYGLVAAGIVLEGEATLFASAFLAWQGIFRPTLVLAAAFVGTIGGDLAWYWTGRLCRLPGPAGRLACRLAGPIDGQLGKRPAKAVFLSKFIYGLTHITLLRAGARRLPLRSFLAGDLPAGLIWMAVVGGFGYSSGASIGLVRHYVKYGEVGLLLTLVVFYLILGLIGRRLRRGAEKART